MNAELLTGRTETHVVEVFPGHFLHQNVVGPYRALVDLARRAGLDLRLASGFRSFNRQLAIWNAKACGERPVLGCDGQPLAMARLGDFDKVCAILRWSALPGASRHHWGTDVDIWDAAAVDSTYRLQLVPEEYAEGGVFYGLTRWLDKTMVRGASAFYRPYDANHGGVAPEPWHLSHRPTAEGFERAMTQTVLREALAQTDILLKQTLLDNLDEIYQRFVMCWH